MLYCDWHHALPRSALSSASLTARVFSRLDSSSARFMLAYVAAAVWAPWLPECVCACGWPLALHHAYHACSVWAVWAVQKVASHIASYTLVGSSKLCSTCNCRAHACWRRGSSAQHPRRLALTRNRWISCKTGPNACTKPAICCSRSAVEPDPRCSMKYSRDGAKLKASYAHVGTAANRMAV